MVRSNSRRIYSKKEREGDSACLKCCEAVQRERKKKWRLEVSLCEMYSKVNDSHFYWPYESYFSPPKVNCYVALTCDTVKTAHPKKQLLKIL